ncbi:hypothetical protein [Undibacterium sp. RuTC16W]|uniref:hypothetical protein n=1 Tax=Undibacterium sp. RuTC16W TaxID=3413048 RepID=UPI003BF05901
MPSRKMLYFCFKGVACREAELFKSYVRVLNVNLKHKWVYSEVTPDLIIYGEAASEIILQKNLRLPYSLVLTSCDIQSEQHLHLPLNSAAIAIAFNRIGTLINGVAEVGKVAPWSDLDTSRCYRMLRWPPTHLLRSRDRMRLATVMTRQAMSITALNKNSGVDIALCKSFVFDLYESGIVVEQSNDMSVKDFTRQITASSVQSGIFSRIRNKLSRLTKGN